MAFEDTIKEIINEVVESKNEKLLASFAQLLNQNNNKVMNRDEVIKYMGLSETTFERRYKTGDIQFMFKYPGCKLFYAEKKDVDDYIQKCKNNYKNG